MTFPTAGPPATGPRVTRSRVLFGVALAVQLVLLYSPQAVQPSGGLPWDKLVHALTFGLVFATGVRAGLPPRPWLAVTLAHAVVSELVQHWLLPHRSGDVYDVLADAAGTLLAALLVARRGGATSDVRNPADGAWRTRE